MYLYIIIAVVVIVALFLIYGKLYTLTKILEEKFRISDAEWNNLRDWLYEFFGQLATIERKITELSDISTIDNPAWGKDSASERKKNNLVRLYTNYLIQKEKLTDEDALCKAKFIINKFGVEAIIIDMRIKTREDESKLEENLRSADFFIKEVKEKAKSLKPIEIFEPLYLGIMKKKYTKGKTLFQKRRDSYSGEDGYKKYVEDVAIIYKLEELGLFKKDTKRGIVRGYILTETDLDLIKSVIFKDLKGNDYHDLESMEMRYNDTDSKNINLPFKSVGEWTEGG